MSDIRWIKITTDIFDDEKILLIESLPEADSIIVIWFKLLCLAGKQNNSGVFVMNDKIPFTDKMLATIFRRKESTVQMALKTFEQFGMVELVDGVITIPNWGKHQSLDQLESRKEYMRNYMKEYRQKQAHLADVSGAKELPSPDERKLYGKVYSKVNVNDAEEEGEKEKEIEKEEEREKTDYKKVVDLFNETCVSFPKLRALSDSRKKAIKARLRTYTLEDFEEVFRKAEASSFLKGGNGRDWSANFDWLMKDGNFAKVLDGNYDDKPKQGGTNQISRAAQELNSFYAMAQDWANSEN